MGRKLFEQGVASVAVPSDVRVQSVEVVDVDGAEHVFIYTEPKEIERKSLLLATVQR